MKKNLDPALKSEAIGLKEKKIRKLCACDPALFAQFYLNFTPDPWQAAFLRSDSDRIILNCSRQSGKSTTTAILALWTAIYKPRSLIVLDSPSLRQSNELMIKFTDFLSLVGEHGSQDVTLDSDTKLSTAFSNGSRVLALPGTEKTIRGLSAVTLIILDEAARIDEALYKSVRPMLAISKGKLVLMSTPYGRQGFYYDVWEKGTNWEKIEVPASLCPRITPEFLADEKASLGELWFRQEYQCDFTALADARIRREWIQYEDIVPQNLKIVMGVDLAISEKETADYTACAVMGRDAKGFLHVLDMQRIRASFQQQIEFIKQMADKWQPSLVAVEDVMYQRVMVQQLSLSSNLTIKAVRPDRDKVSRFAPLESRYEQKQVFHLRGLPNYFEAELLTFPVSEHDDLEDAMSTAWAGLNEPKDTMLTFSTTPIARPYAGAGRTF
jgi:predicted phage terminase large subunit-like protein